MVNTGVSKTPASEAKDLGSNPSGAANRTKFNKAQTAILHNIRSYLVIIVIVS